MANSYEYWINTFGVEFENWFEINKENPTLNEFLLKRDNNLKACVRKYFQGNFSLWLDFCKFIDNDFSKISGCFNFKLNYTNFIYEQNKDVVKEKTKTYKQTTIDEYLNKSNNNKDDNDLRTNLKLALSLINENLIEIKEKQDILLDKKSNDHSSFHIVNPEGIELKKILFKGLEFSILILILILFTLLIGVIFK